LLAEAAFKAGADVILGHHPHIPKAIAMHAGKPCFYSLGSFAMSTFARTPERAKASAKRYNISMDPDYPNLPFGVDAKRSLIAKVVLTRQGIASAAFLPVHIDPELRPNVLHEGDPRFSDAVHYMRWASEHFPHKFVVQGDEVKVTAP
jgi:poly-gamma-glutamate synthesis protein (capsule biosynthesis protein)